MSENDLLCPDYAQVERTFSRAAQTYYQNAIIQNSMGERLLELASYYFPELRRTHFNRVLELGCGPGNFTLELVKNYAFQELYVNDLSASMLDICKSLVLRENPKACLKLAAGNALECKLPYECDLICSNAALQWFPDLEGIIGRMARLTLHNPRSRASHKPDRGPRYLIFSSFLDGTFAEFKDIGGMGLRYITRPEVHAVLKKYCEEYYIEVQQFKQHFSSMNALLRHLKDTGVNAVHNPLGLHDLKNFMNEYSGRYRDGEGVYVSWVPYYALGRLKSPLLLHEQFAEEP